MIEPDEYWALVQRGTGDQCWIWQGPRDKDGYGILVRGGRQYRAHRVALSMAGRPIERGMNACHTCDRRTCVNPDHLYAGTHQENVADRVERDRTARGTSNGRAKLDEAAVVAIRRRHARGDAKRRLAKEYGVSPRTIDFIVRRLRWQHVP